MQSSVVTLWRHSALRHQFLLLECKLGHSAVDSIEHHDSWWCWSTGGSNFIHACVFAHNIQHLIRPVQMAGAMNELRDSVIAEVQHARWRSRWTKTMMYRVTKTQHFWRPIRSLTTTFCNSTHRLFVLQNCFKRDAALMHNKEVTSTLPVRLLQAN